MIYRENAGGGDQSSPTEYKRGDYRKMTDCQLTANEEGDHKNITEPYGGGDHKNITEPYGISGKFHRTQPKTSDPPPGDKL